MAQSPCRSLWRDSAPAISDLSHLEGEHQVEVVIVGGGFTGLSTALHLAKQGVSVAVLEANEIGFGGSGRNVGLVNAGVWLEPELLDKTLGKVAGRRMYDALAVAPDYVFQLIAEYDIACEATRHGTLHASVGKSGLAQLQRRCRQMQERGAPVSLLSEQEAQQRIGSNKFNAALFDPRAGTIQPLAYVRGLARAALQEGASIFEGSPVTAIEKSQNGWQVSSKQGSIQAAKVILATNAYCQDGVADLACKFVPIAYSQLASKPLTESQLTHILPNKEGVWDTCTVMSSFRLDQAGRLIFGGMGAEGRVLSNWASQRVADIFPMLEKVEWEFCWTGNIAYSADHLPHCQQLEQGLWSISGYSGRGIGPGTVLGAELADWLIGKREQLSVPTSTLKDIPFREIQRLFYELGAQTYHLGQQTHALN